MKYYIKIIKSWPVILTISLIIPVCSCGSGLGGLLDKPVEPVTIPVSPAEIQATKGIFPDKVTVTWSATDDAEGYRVYRSDTANGTYTQVGNDLGMVMTFDDTSGLYSTSYFYRVTAFNDCGESEQSDYAEGWLLAPPSQVTGVHATDGTIYRKITIEWSESPDQPSSYSIYKSDSSSGTYTLLQSGITLLSYTDESTDIAGAGIHRFYKVCAVNAAGAGTESTCEEGSTMAIPSNPSDVTASDGSYYDRIIVTWTASTGYPSSYTIYIYDTSDCSGTPAIISNIVNLKYQDMVLLTPPVTRYYKVCAVNDAGESPFSTAIKGSTYDVGSPTVPASITTTQGTLAGFINISWEAPGGATGYHIYRSNSQYGDYSLLASCSMDELSYNDPTDPGVHWFYKVSAYNSVGESVTTSLAEGWAKTL